jgi:hypothetical protein
VLILGGGSPLSELDQLVKAQVQGGGNGRDEGEARICAFALFDLRKRLGGDLSGEGQFGPGETTVKAPLPQHCSHCASEVFAWPDHATRTT